MWLNSYKVVTHWEDVKAKMRSVSKDLYIYTTIEYLSVCRGSSEDERRERRLLLFWFVSSSIWHQKMITRVDIIEIVLQYSTNAWICCWLLMISDLTCLLPCAYQIFLYSTHNLYLWMWTWAKYYCLLTICEYSSSQKVHTIIHIIQYKHTIVDLDCRYIW